MSHAKQYLTEAATICGLLDAAEIDRMASELATIKGRVFVVGLGGSAANASHMVNDLRKLCALQAFSPSDNVAELTARANDEGWNNIYADWLRASNANYEDALFVLSVGGGSGNVSVPLVTAIAHAKVMGLKIYGIVGRDGGYTAQCAGCCIIVPTVNDSRVTPHTEAFQAVVWHCLISNPILQKGATKW